MALKPLACVADESSATQAMKPLNRNFLTLQIVVSCFADHYSIIQNARF